MTTRHLTRALLACGLGCALIGVIWAAGTIHAAESQRQGRELPDPVPCDSALGSCYAPPVLTSWQWQLSCDNADTCTNLDVVVDWYDIDWEDTPPETVEAIHTSAAHAACYFSAGSWEDWRGDADAFPVDVIGYDYEGWEGERWLDVRRVDVLEPLMAARMDVCRAKGFDGVQFDNLDVWNNDSGFPLTPQDGLTYAVWLANMAHSKGLSAGWENAPEMVEALLPYMDWFIMEECQAWDECEMGTPFVEAGKFVGEVEYDDQFRDLAFCDADRMLGISGMFKTLDLDSFRLACPAESES